MPVWGHYISRLPRVAVIMVESGGKREPQNAGDMVDGRLFRQLKHINKFTIQVVDLLFLTTFWTFDYSKVKTHQRTDIREEKVDSVKERMRKLRPVCIGPSEQESSLQQERRHIHTLEAHYVFY